MEAIMNQAAQVQDSRAQVKKILHCHAVLWIKDSRPLLVQTVDIGELGICVMAPWQVAQGRECNISFDTPVDGRLLHVSALMKVLYSVCVGTDGFRIGLQLLEADPNSRAALHQIASSRTLQTSHTSVNWRAI